MIEEGPLIFASEAHALCRKWKKATGLTNAHIAEHLSNLSKQKIHQSNVSRWMGDAEDCARLIPEKHAYTFYWEFYMKEKYSCWQAFSEELDNYFSQKSDPPRNMDDYFDNKGKFTRFPYYEYLRYRRAINAVLLDKAELSDEQLLQKLRERESSPEAEIADTFEELREIIESVLSENQAGADLLPGLHLTDARKRILWMLFHYWVRLEDRNDTSWEFVQPLWGNPKNAKNILMKLLKEDK